MKRMPDADFALLVRPALRLSDLKSVRLIVAEAKRARASEKRRRRA